MYGGTERERVFILIFLRVHDIIKTGDVLMAELKAIPMGIEDFKTIIDKKCYFVDKTLMIKDLIDSRAMVTLFTRPRRFGKTLNMSMICRYFEKTDEDNSYLFRGLKISETGTEYLEYMGKYPVISVSLKSMKQPNFEMAFSEFKKLIANEVWRHNEILNSESIMPSQLEKLNLICRGTAENSDYYTSLKLLSDCLFEVYGEKVIILIDEYDVPLENAYFRGFYEQMTDLVRSVFESALKTNFSLEFAVLTGCLRISKESIFTGLNNLKVNSVRSGEFSEYFGFTEKEVESLAKYYSIENKMPDIKKWYDGYRFGITEIYNPWSVLNYIQNEIAISDSPPEPYWSNTSSNSIIHKLVTESDETTREMIEELVNGSSITVPIHEDIVYSDIDVNTEQIWSFLLLTGYLKQISTELRNNIIYITVMIPNLEIKSIYQRTILQWFREKTNSNSRDELFNALVSRNTQAVEDIICDWLDETISFYDEKEQYYHGFLTGLFSGFKGYSLKSNRESGDGRPDLLILERKRRKTAIIIEIKADKDFLKLDDLCNQALNQIEINRYESELVQEGYSDIIKYGIAFCKKSCKVKSK